MLLHEIFLDQILRTYLKMLDSRVMAVFAYLEDRSELAKQCLHNLPTCTCTCMYAKNSNRMEKNLEQEWNGPLY